MFHHLTWPEKRAALDQALRLLAPGGRLVVADWGPPAGFLGRAAFAVTRLFDGFAVTRAHADGSFAAMLADAGVAAFTERGRWPTAVGTLCLYTARKP
jgi:SAM-dependent methyltransferase